MFLLVSVAVCMLALSEAGLPGGGGFPYDVEITKTILSTARFAVTEFNKVNKDKFYYTLLKIMSAKAQVVAGINYILDVHLVRTSCLKNDANGESCVHDLGSNKNLTSEVYNCHFVVLEEAWKDSRTVTEANCNPL